MGEEVRDDSHPPPSRLLRRGARTRGRLGEVETGPEAPLVREGEGRTVSLGRRTFKFAPVFLRLKFCVETSWAKGGAGE